MITANATMPVSIQLPLVHNTIHHPYYVNEEEVVHRGGGRTPIGILENIISNEEFNRLQCEFWSHGEFLIEPRLLYRTPPESVYDPSMHLVIDPYDTKGGVNGRLLITPASIPVEPTVNSNQRSERLSRRPTMPRNRRADELIKIGATQLEIARALGKTSRETGRKYMWRTDQHHIWRDAKLEKIEAKIEAKEQQKKKNRILRELASQLEKITIDLTAAAEGNQAYQMAFHYTKLEPDTRYSPIQLIKFFGAYDRAKQGKREPVWKLAEYAGLEYYQGERILTTLNLPGLCCRGNRFVPSTEQEGMLDRSFDTGMSIKDITHFTGVPEYVVKTHLRRISNQRKIPRRIMRRFQLGKLAPTYRKPSRIFEALDAGLTPTETCEYYSEDPKKVEHMMQHSTEIRQAIVADLRILVNDPDLITPYL